MVEHQDMLMCLTLIDDATERAAFDYGQEIVTTGVCSDEQTARHGRAPSRFPAQDEIEVPNIVVNGAAAIRCAIEGNELETVLRQLLEPATPLRLRPDSHSPDPSLGPKALGPNLAHSRHASRSWSRNLGLVERAIEVAVMAHEGQRRKESGGPYIAHPLAVALHLACCGYDEQCIAAALVHDAIEDTVWDEARLDEALGDRAERCRALVRFATEPPKDVSWRTRKSGVVAKLAGASRDERALVIADKSHNLRSILRGLRKRGERAWGALRHGRREQSWFAHSMKEAVRYETGEPFRSFVATVQGAVGEGWLDAA